MKTAAIIGIWVVSGLAITVGIYVTHNAHCLWALFIPALITSEFL